TFSLRSTTPLVTAWLRLATRSAPDALALASVALERIIQSAAFTAGEAVAFQPRGSCTVTLAPAGMATPADSLSRSVSATGALVAMPALSVWLRRSLDAMGLPEPSTK